MKTLYLALGILVLLSGTATATKFCDACPSRGDECFFIATLIRIDTVEGLGRIYINLQEYWVGGFCADDNMSYIVERPCDEHDVVYEERLPYFGCGVDCMPGDCDGYIEECGYYAHFYHDDDYMFATSGKGILRILHGAQQLLSVEFDFGRYGEYGSPEFSYIKFLNRNNIDITNGDKFDAFESVAIEVGAEWPDEPAPSILIELKSDLGPDPIHYEAILRESMNNTGIYRVLLPPGSLIPIIGDPNDLMPWGETIKAVPMPNSCDGEPGQIYDELTVVNYILSVEEVSFLDDYQLYKDSVVTNDTIIVPITDPV